VTHDASNISRERVTKESECLAQSASGGLGLSAVVTVSMGSR